MTKLLKSIVAAYAPERTLRELAKLENIKREMSVLRSNAACLAHCMETEVHNAIHGRNLPESARAALDEMGIRYRPPQNYAPDQCPECGKIRNGDYQFHQDRQVVAELTDIPVA